MMLGLSMLGANLGVSLENIIFIVLLVGSIIFYAKDFRLGSVMQLFVMSGLFMMDYALGWDWSKPLIVMLLSLVVLAFTLMFSMQESSSGGMI